MTQTETHKEKREKSKIDKTFIPDYDYLFAEGKWDKKHIRKKKLSLFGKLIRLNVLPLTFSTLIYFLQALPTWVLPVVSANLIDIITDALGAGGMTSADWRLFVINVIILAVAILQNVPTTMWRYNIVSKLLRRTSAGIKSSVVRKLQSLSITYHKDMETGRIQSKFIKDTEQIDMMLNLLLFGIIPNAIGIIVATAISVYKNGWVALFFLLVIPCNVALSFAFRKKVRKSYRNFRIENEGMSAKLNDMLTIMPVTKSHGLEQTEIATFSNTLKGVMGAGYRVDKTNAVFGSSAWVVNTFLSASCLVFCCIMAYLGHISVGDILLYQTMFAQISGYVSSLVNNMPALASGTEAFRSVSEIMNATDVEVNVGKIKVPVIDGNVTFNNLSYSYPNSEQLVVKDFSLNVSVGECIAVVGASGSGKTTLMNLIIGFLKPTSGELLIDGKSITDLNLTDYRHNISVVSQNSILLSGTIKENITYGLPCYSEEDLKRALDMANVTEFLNDMPKGIDTEVGENGTKLSGGQKQRVTIARALIRNPRILILDEATSALDNISEYHVQQAIQKSIIGRTTFVVAHRLSTIRNANRIVVMENGEIVETGTFDELLAKKGKFYELKSLNDLNFREAEESLV